MAPELSPRARQILEEVERDAQTARRAPGDADPAPAPVPDRHAELVALADELVRQAERVRDWFQRLEAAVEAPGHLRGDAASGASASTAWFGDRARLAAVELAVAGYARTAIRERLVADYGLGEPDGLLDAIFGDDRTADARMPLGDDRAS